MYTYVYLNLIWSEERRKQQQEEEEEEETASATATTTTTTVRTTINSVGLKEEKQTKQTTITHEHMQKEERERK